jgi:glycosyltransferase involved in cell wall biosynthesis
MHQLSKTNRPLVSVVIPAYNAEQFITQTLKSVLAQSYKNLEILVVNDGSTDRTAALVKRLARQDSRIQLLNQVNAGVAAARNLAIQQANGTFVALIDADDLWHADQIAKQVNCFLDSPNTVGLIYSWSVDIDEQGRRLPGIHAAKITGNVYATLLCHNFLGNASCTMMRRSSLVQVGGYDESFQARNAYGCEDWDLYLRIAEKYEFRVVSEFLVGYRKLRHSMSYNYDRMARSHLLMLQGIQRRHPQLSSWLYRLSRSSFYLYFGHQASEYGADREALHWVMQAVKVDITPWFRIGTYGLALKSWLRLQFPAKPPSPAFRQAIPNQFALAPHRQPAHSGVQLLTAPHHPQPNLSQAKRTALLTETKVLPKPEFLLPFTHRREKIASLRVMFKVLVGSALHQVLSLLGER